MIQIKRFIFNPFQENTFVVYNESKECIIVDSGAYSDSDKQTLKDFIAQNQLKPTKLVNTHGHIDHMLGVAYCKKLYGINFEIHADDKFLIDAAEESGAAYGFIVDEIPEINHTLIEGDRIKLGNDELEVIHVPGHSPGHIALYAKNEKFVIVGDVLFAGSIGRTDLPGGDYDVLMKSIKEKLLPLGDDVIVFPGHGPETDIHTERLKNPFLID